MGVRIEQMPHQDSRNPLSPLLRCAASCSAVWFESLRPLQLLMGVRIEQMPHQASRNLLSPLLRCAASCSAGRFESLRPLGFHAQRG